MCCVSPVRNAFSSITDLCQEMIWKLKFNSSLNDSWHPCLLQSQSVKFPISRKVDFRGSSWKPQICSVSGYWFWATKTLLESFLKTAWSVFLIRSHRSWEELCLTRPSGSKHRLKATKWLFLEALLPRMKFNFFLEDGHKLLIVIIRLHWFAYLFRQLTHFIILILTRIHRLKKVQRRGPHPITRSDRESAENTSNLSDFLP